MTSPNSRPPRRHGAPAWCAALVLLALGAASAQAQSVSGGRVTGTVSDSAGTFLYDVAVSLVNPTTGVEREVVTRRDGVFDFPLLQPGEYDLLVQRFGFQPRRVLRVPVRARAAVVFDVRLAAGGPELGVDTLPFPGAPAGGTHVSLQHGDVDDDFASMVNPRGWLVPVGLLLPGGDGQLGAAGLPGRLNASAVDGVTRWSPRHPRVAGAELDGVVFPLTALRGAELLPGGVDVEWPGSGGGVLSAYTTGGPRRTQGSVALAGGSDGFTGSLEFGGALVRDTAHFAFGVTASRLTPALPEAWNDTSAMTAAAVAIARDSFQTDLAPYRDTRSPVQTAVAAYARFDGIIASQHTVSVRAAGASSTIEDEPLGPNVAPVIDGQVKTRDLSGGATLTSYFGRNWGSELRLSAEAGDRNFEGPGLVGTQFIDGGFAAGTSDLQPALIKRSTLRASETVHWRLRPTLNFKAGLTAAVNSHDITFADHRSGRYAFGDTTGFASRTGSFRQTVGSLPSARFTIMNVGVYGQAAYRPIPGFEVLAGLRWDVEDWPSEDILLNPQWQTLTGLDNRPARGARYLLAPRVAFTWSLGANRGWQVRGEAGLFGDPLDPGVFAEAVTHARGVQVRRGFGALGAWPNVPDSTAAPVSGQTMTMLGEEFNAPRTGRAVFGIAGNLGGGVVLRFDGDYRHTDFLPLRRDLNLAVNPAGRDQFGRTLYGTLVKAGTLVAAQPGTNRRFDTFDEVSVLDPAASSDYIGISLALEKLVGRFAFNMAYTYSRTQDNWYGARGNGSEAQFVPFADSTGRSRWARAQSDFDVPHRLLLGTEWRLGRSQGVRLAVMYRLQSGYPFTPGFRDGVDANGDGSARNDPAFLSDTVAGATDVFAQHSCLRKGTGDFAERNSCRDPMITSLDMRLAMVVARIRGRAAELIVDGFGLLRTGMDQYDHALYLVDGAAPLVTNPVNNVTTVPLVANPNFGEKLIKRTPTASVRAGLRVAF